MCVLNAEWMERATAVKSEAEFYQFQRGRKGRKGGGEGKAVTAHEICPLLKGATAAEAYPVFFYWDRLKNGS